jgi:hypothetical protein
MGVVTIHSSVVTVRAWYWQQPLTSPGPLFACQAARIEKGDDDSRLHTTVLVPPVSPGRLPMES